MKRNRMVSNSSITLIFNYKLNHTVSSKTVPLVGKVSAQEYQIYNTIFTWIKVIGHPISLVCLILSIVIFAKKSMRNSSTTFLIALNLAEAYSVATLAIFQACSFDKKCSDTWLYNNFKLYSTTYLGIASQRCVYVYNCLVSVQRCLVVAYPVKFKTNRVLNEPLAVCVFVLLLSLTLHAYIPVKYAVVSKNNSHIITESRLATSHVSLFNALTSTSMYLLMYTPLILGTTSNLVMCVALRRHALNMRRSSATPGTSKRRDSQMSTGILVSTFLFFTLSLPSNVNQLVSLHVDKYGALKAEQYLYQTLSGAFVVVQVVRDLMIFVSFTCASPSFRRHLLNIVSLALVRRQSSDPKEVSQSPATETSQLSIIMETKYKANHF